MYKLPISEIIIWSRKRLPKNTDALKQSIKELGLLNPITVNKHKVLIAGYHRLMACKELGWQEIPVVVMNYDNLEAELAQIDENIIRNRLTALENAEQLFRRKEIYEILHPDAKPEVIRVSKLKHNSSFGNDFRTMNPVTFVNDVVNKTSKTDRAIRLYLQVGSKLTKEIIALLKGSDIEDNLRDLLTLTKIESIEKQKEVINKVLNGEAKTVRAALEPQQQSKIKPARMNKTTVPTKAYRKLLNEYYALEVKCFELEEELEKLKT